MRWRSSVWASLAVLTTIIGAATQLGSASAATTAGLREVKPPPPPQVPWGQARELPGLGALNTGGAVVIHSASCGSPGNCAVGGSYKLRSGKREAFVASERNGHWAGAIEVPGSAALNTGGFAETLSVSCPSAGTCAAAGYYRQAGGHQQAFLVSEKGGSWSTAISVPGLAALNLGGSATATSVSCPSAGNCAAGGSYADADATRAFVVSEKSGHWGTATNVPLPGNPDVTHSSGHTNSISCATAGNCAAGGSDLSSQDLSAFVVSAKNGRWGAAQDLRGGGAVPATGDAEILSVSCPTAGNCAAGGYFVGRTGLHSALVVGERNGKWGTASQVPGTTSGGELLSLSCASPGNCGAGGFDSGAHRTSGFVVSERNGHWATAIQVPVSAGLAGGRLTEILSVSCASPGSCVAGGTSKDRSLRLQAIVMIETKGSWGKVAEVPGSARLNAGGGAEVHSVSCASASSCVAAGTYRDSARKIQGFVVSHS